MDTEINEEIWQVEAGGQVFDASFDEMTDWIGRGELLRIDRVRRGNLRWIEAGKVPQLAVVFNAKENGEPPPPPVITVNKFDLSATGTSTGQNVESPAAEFSNVCSVHPETPAAYLCGTCFSKFCKSCPNSYGSNVKICPMCGAMCEAFASHTEQQKPKFEFRSYSGGKFGFSDLGQALAYPFKFKTSLVLGGIMFMLFSLAGGASAFGGVFMIWGALASALMANALTNGILANTVEKFSQGKVGENFMPTFDDFSIWDDVVHPFFLSIGAYLVSFGPLVVTMVVAFFLVAGAVKDEMSGMSSDAARTVSPGLPYAAKSVQNGEKLKEIIKQSADQQKQRADQLNNFTQMAESSEGPGDPPSITTGTSPREMPAAGDDGDGAAAMDKLIREQQKAQLEAAVGKAPETRAAERSAFVRQILSYGLLFIVLGGAALIWGLFYFPAACAVAGYTRSFGATLNPTVGLDTIRRLGVDYAKILLMTLLLVIGGAIVSGVLDRAFSAFDMPSVGNLPARAVGSLFTFYFAIVFSCILGFALCKGRDRLHLPS